MRRLLVVVVMSVVVLGLIVPEDALAQFTFPNHAGAFADELVLDDLGQPTALGWLAADELVVAVRSGTVFLQSGGGDPQSVLDLADVCTDNEEQGLLGLAVDPDFAQNAFIYVYYTRDAGTVCQNRVSRFTQGGNGSFGAELVLIDHIPSPNGNHNGGDLQFDNAGRLYVTVGDGGRDLETGQGQDSNGNARRRDLLLGKVLRINADGSIPASNPFLGARTARCAATGGLESQSQELRAEAKKSKKQRKKKRKKRRNKGGKPTVCREIFATGLRNPYRIAFDPTDQSGAQRFFINDVGGNGFEEVNEGEAGADYGWNVCEGPNRINSADPCPASQNGFEEPLFAFGHGQGGDDFSDCFVITGGAFVPASGDWPGDYLFADLGCQRLFALDESTSPVTVSVFGDDAGVTHLAFGPDGALYYTTFAGGGQVRRIVEVP
jgi:glucose/arabinose dehydrogenase